METVTVEMINPFTCSDTNALVNIASGLQASEKKITNDFVQLTKKRIKYFEKLKKITKLNLKTMANTIKSRKTEKTVYKK